VYLGEVSFMLNDNTTDLQLRWIHYNASESAAWFIDEISVDCEMFRATITFEEEDRLETFCLLNFIIILLLLELYIIFGGVILVMWRQAILTVYVVGLNLIY